MKKILYIIGLLSIVFFTGCSTKVENETVVKINNKEGLLDDNSEILIKPTYKSIYTLKGSSFKYMHSNYANFHWIEDEDENVYAIVQSQNEKYGVVNREGDLLLKPIYDEIGSFYNGFASIKENKKYGLINQKFEVVVKPTYDESLKFIYGAIIVKKYGKYGCIDQNLELKIAPVFDMIYLQRENFKRMELNNKWGFLDNQCNIVAKPIYDYAYDFSHGFSKVKKNNRWGFIDTNGDFLIKPVFEDSDQF